MNRSQSIDRLELHNYQLLHQNVDAIAAVEENSFVLHGELKLPLEGNLAQGQLMAEALFISGFEQARTEGTMNFNGAPNDNFCQRVYLHRLLCVSAPLR